MPREVVDLAFDPVLRLARIRLEYPRVIPPHMRPGYYNVERTPPAVPVGPVAPPDPIMPLDTVEPRQDNINAQTLADEEFAMRLQCEEWGEPMEIGESSNAVSSSSTAGNELSWEQLVDWEPRGHGEVSTSGAPTLRQLSTGISTEAVAQLPGMHSSKSPSSYPYAYTACLPSRGQGPPTSPRSEQSSDNRATR